MTVQSNSKLSVIRLSTSQTSTHSQSVFFSMTMQWHSGILFGFYVCWGPGLILLCCEQQQWLKVSSYSSAVSEPSLWNKIDSPLLLPDSHASCLKCLVFLLLESLKWPFHRFLNPKWGDFLSPCCSLKIWFSKFSLYFFCFPSPFMSDFSLFLPFFFFLILILVVIFFLLGFIGLLLF